MYAYSKFQFDQYVRRHLPEISCQVVGLRYFNVYGPRETHKGAMASTAWHFYQQIKEKGTAKLFSGCDGYGDVNNDVISFMSVIVLILNLWFLDNPDKSGIYNCGTGKAETFNEMVSAVTFYLGRGRVEYIPFPDHLLGAYQSYTRGDLTKLRGIGCSHVFKPVRLGVKEYLDCLN